MKNYNKYISKKITFLLNERREDAPWPPPGVVTRPMTPQDWEDIDMPDGLPGGGQLPGPDWEPEPTPVEYPNMQDGAPWWWGLLPGVGVIGGGILGTWFGPDNTNYGAYPENQPWFQLPATYEVPDGTQGPVTLPGQQIT